MYGYAGHMLKVDLSRGKTKIEPLEKELASLYIGGKGFGAKILYDQMRPRIDPYDPESLLVFATGPVNGLPLSGAAKLCAVFKSPLTEIWGESQCGGFFAPHLKFAGYDAMILYGRSEKPVYITIDDKEIEIRDATHLWGKDSYETRRI